MVHQCAESFDVFGRAAADDDVQQARQIGLPRSPGEFAKFVAGDDD